MYIFIGILSIYEAILAYEKSNKNIQIVLLLDYTVGSDAIISQPEIKHLTDLKHKKIGVEQNTISHYTLHHALKRSGINKDEINIVYESQENLITLFKERKLDAISLFDPYIFDLLNENSKRNILFSSEEIPRKICDVVFAKKEWIKNNKDTLNVLKNVWFEEINSSFKFSKLNRISNKHYLENINNKIHLTGETENKFAFGTKTKPGYLLNSIVEMSHFLKHKSLINTNIDQDILYYD